MNAEQIARIREAWAHIDPVRERAGETFYHRLFELYPALRPRFTGDMQEQGRRLMAMMDVAVAGLDDLDALQATLAASGRAHRALGVHDADYAKVAEALLWTLERQLGERFDAPMREAWTALYITLANTMTEGRAFPTT